nr:PIN domain-containing protein [Deltaproteobacteria bacterium]
MKKRLLDSVILIDHFNGIEKASKFLTGLDPLKTVVSVITYAEILVGFDEAESTPAKALLDQYAVLGIDAAVAERAAALRRQFGWKLPDAFQAALALTHQLMLCTRNTKDFDPAKHNFIEVPYTL